MKQLIKIFCICNLQTGVSSLLMVEGMIFDIIIAYMNHLKETSKESGKCDFLCLVNYWHVTAAYHLIKIENFKFHLKFAMHIENSLYKLSSFILKQM